jgi:outer membrane murein-binding lipoprotein Lpp
VTQQEFWHAIEELNERIDQMATQADVDALTTQVQQVAGDLANAQTKLQSEIDQLAANNPSVDLSGLQAAVAPLDSAVQSLGAITPTPPAAPADTPAPPTDVTG